MKKKLVLFGLIFIVTIFSLTGCSISKNKVTGDAFKNQMTAANFTVVDGKSQFERYDYVSEVYLARHKEYGYQVEFYVLKDKEYALKVFGIERGNKKPRKDILKWSDVKENVEYMYNELFDKNEEEYPFQVINDKESIEKILKLYVEKYYDENDDKQTWFDKIKELSGEMGYAKEVKEFKANPGMYTAHVGDVSTVLRVALTKRTNTPDLYEIMQVLGKEEIERRLRQ